MKELQPPAREQEDYTVFLAGSIEMGVAEDWQTRIVKTFATHPVTFYNPRRTDWDSSWEQVAKPSTPFYTQVEWEIDHIEMADLVIVNFDPDTKSPISLLELGFLCGTKPRQTIVYCPEGFWRKGNVDFMCSRYGVGQASSWQNLLAIINHQISVYTRD